MKTAAKDDNFSIILGKRLKLTISEQSVHQRKPSSGKLGRGRQPKSATSCTSSSSSSSHVVTALSSKDCLDVWQKAKKANKEKYLLNLFKRCNEQLLDRLKNDCMTERDETYMVNLLCQTGVVQMNHENNDTVADTVAMETTNTTSDNSQSAEIVTKNEPDPQQGETHVNRNVAPGNKVTGTVVRTTAVQGIRIKQEKEDIDQVHIAHIVQDTDTDVKREDDNNDFYVIKVKEEVVD